MATTGRADVLATVPTLFAKDILKYTMPNLEFWKRIRTKDPELNAEIGDRVQFPVWNDNSTPNTGSTAVRQLHTGTAAGFSGTAELDPLVATYDDQTITSTVTVFLANWFYLGMELSSYAEAVTQNNLEEAFGEAGLDSLATQMDTSVANLITGLTTNAARGTLGTALTDDVILDGQSDLDGQNIPGSDRHYIFSHLEKANYLKIDKYVNSLYRGNTTPLTRGELGDLYGMSWAWTTQVPLPGAGQHRNVMFHRHTWGGSVRKQPKTRVADSPDPGFATRIISMALWGVNELRDRFGIEMRGV